MAGILVLADQRRGELRDVSCEMLVSAAKVAPLFGGEITAVLFGSGVDAMAEKLAGYCDKVLYVDDPLFADYNSEKYQIAMSALIKQYQPGLVLVSHTTQGVDMAPALAVELNMPYVSDVINIEPMDGGVKATRTYYSGKVNSDYLVKSDSPALITLRESCVTVGEPDKKGVIEKIASPLTEDIAAKKFVEYLEAAAGDVDITQADVLVSVGRGIQGTDTLPLIQELADALGATISCSRAVVDAGWLPKERQVGTSGKTVKPKVYIAIGISGAFEHVAGMKGSKAIIAINKDPKAPIFNVATYGIVDDLFKVVPAIIQKIKEIRAA